MQIQNPFPEKIQQFIAWLDHENIVWDRQNVSLEFHPSQGFYFLIKNNLSANAPLFESRPNLCLSKHTASEHHLLGELFLQMKQLLVTSSNIFTVNEFYRAIVQALLMYEKYLDHQSVWAPYLKILPSLEELENRIPSLMNLAVTLPSLHGSYLQEVTLPAHQQILEKSYSHLIFPIFSQLFTPEIVSTAFSFQDFKWAAGIFFSRAILIPDHTGQTVEALCPLLDLMNHRPGTLSTIKMTGKLKEQRLVYSIGRSLKPGEEVSLNYGSRSNGDLLAYFGFTLSNNMADVSMMTIPSFSPSSADHDHTRSFVLFVGCDLPADLLDFIRQRIAFEESASVPFSSSPSLGLELVYDLPPPSPLSSWLDFTTNEDDTLSPLTDTSLGTVLSLSNETLTLRWLQDTFEHKANEITQTLQRNDEELLYLTLHYPSPPNARAMFLSDCQEYLRGQIRIFEYLAKKLEQMTGALRRRREGGGDVQDER
jgi:hypothetical protein